MPHRGCPADLPVEAGPSGTGSPNAAPTTVGRHTSKRAWEVTLFSFEEEPVKAMPPTTNIADDEAPALATSRWSGWRARSPSCPLISTPPRAAQRAMAPRRRRQFVPSARLTPEQVALVRQALEAAPESVDNASAESLSTGLGVPRSTPGRRLGDHGRELPPSTGRSSMRTAGSASTSTTSPPCPPGPANGSTSVSAWTLCSARLSREPPNAAPPVGEAPAQR